MNKIITPVTLFSLLFTPAIVAAEDHGNGIDIPGEFSMTAAITSDYVFRGVAQSDEEPAIQGSLDYSVTLGQAGGNDVGLYLGVWGSNVDFNDGDEANSEFDFYGGLTHEIEGISIDVGAIYYTYPGASDSLNYDFWEVQAALGYDFGVASIGASINHSPENFGDSGDATYYKASAEVPLPHSFFIDGHVGRQLIDDEATFGLPDYTDWAIGVGTTIEGIDLKLDYVDTNLNSTECADGCDAKAVFTISKSF